jgi:hypothetical protein
MDSLHILQNADGIEIEAHILQEFLNISRESRITPIRIMSIDLMDHFELYWIYGCIELLFVTYMVVPQDFII